MINLLTESNGWYVIALCLALAVVLCIVTLSASHKQGKKLFYSTAEKICNGLSKMTFAIGIAGATKLTWDYNDPQNYGYLCIIITMLAFVALAFDELADIVKEKRK